jgi:uncharacterized phosphosugar-binding protein
MAIEGAQQYIEAAVEALERLVAGQADEVARAAEIVVDAVAEGGSIFAFGASHSFIIAEELVYRTGGLMLVNPIFPHGMNLSVRPMTMTSKLERIEGLGRELLNGSPARPGDVLLIASTSGRNAVAIDMALAARERDVRVIGITSVAYSRGVTSRHSSGKRLLDLCDLVLDNGAPLGDAAVELPGFPQKVGPLSTVLGCALVNALVVEVAALLLRRGMEPPVFMSANLDGGDEYNARMLSRYGDRIHYM